ncbi:hypothetical protein GF385_03985 [Candidatus Dependentiae bacterium]|nr:hypothetical protein [Candidatus Dependentiae bacterium]
MKKGILLIFLFLSTFNNLKPWFNKNKLSKDLRSVLVDQGIDMEQSATNLLFDYQIYKKMIQDEFLDKLIKKAGFEANEENRTIFFSAISKDLQEHIKKSFSEFTRSPNTSIDPNLYLQLEMTRNFPAILTSMGSKIQKSKNSSKFYLVLVAVAAYFITKFGILGKSIKLSYGYMKAKENVDKISEKTKNTTSYLWNKLRKFGQTVGRPFTLMDYSKDYKDSEEFFKFYRLFENILKDDKEFVEKKAKNYTEVHVYYKEGKDTKRVRYPRNPDLSLD